MTTDSFDFVPPVLRLATLEVSNFSVVIYYPTKFAVTIDKLTVVLEQHMITFCQGNLARFTYLRFEFLCYPQCIIRMDVTIVWLL